MSEQSTDGTEQDDAIAEPNHGLNSDNILDACDLCGGRSVREMDVQNEETGEMATVWLCSDCVDRTEAYNAGDESAFDDLSTETQQEADR
jgi:hypothetical protein